MKGGVSIKNMIRESEKNTLEAINDLVRNEKPFVAGMLSYVMIERCLKIYLIENRSTITESQIDFDAKVGKEKLSFRQFQKSTHDDFMLKYIMTLTLGALEIIFRIQNNKIAERRNELVHSGIYIICQSQDSENERQNDNVKELEYSIDKLIYVSENCFKEPIVRNVNGELVFKC
jgi:hypothetical protein